MARLNWVVNYAGERQSRRMIKSEALSRLAIFKDAVSIEKVQGWFRREIVPSTYARLASSVGWRSLNLQRCVACRRDVYIPQLQGVAFVCPHCSHEQEICSHRYMGGGLSDCPTCRLARRDFVASARQFLADGRLKNLRDESPACPKDYLGANARRGQKDGKT